MNLFAQQKSNTLEMTDKIHIRWPKGCGRSIIPEVKPAYHSRQQVCVGVFVHEECVCVCAPNSLNMVNKNQETRMKDSVSSINVYDE